MNVYDFIKDGRLNTDLLEQMKKTVKYKEEKGDTSDFLLFDNEFVYITWHHNDEVDSYTICDANQKSARFNKNKILSSIMDQSTKVSFHYSSDGKYLSTVERKNPDGSTEYFQDDGKTLKKIKYFGGITDVYQDDGKTLQKTIYGNGCYIKFYDDGKSIKFYKKSKDDDVIYFNEIKGKLLAEKKPEEIDLLLPLINQLPILDFKIIKNGFINEMADEVDESKLSPLPDGCKAIFLPNFIKDEDVPLSLKNLGIKIKREVIDVFVEYDENKNKYIYKDGKVLTSKVYASASSNIKFITRRYILKEEDYQRLDKLKSKVQTAVENADKDKKIDAKWKVLDDTDKPLEYLYLDIFNDKKSILTTLYHEAKHIVNGILCDHRAFASDYKVPLTEELFKLEIEEERSATYETLNRVITTYFTNGNFLYAFYPDFMWVAEKFQHCSKEEIRDKLYPPIEIMNEALQRWNDDKLETYFRQIKDRCLNKSDKSLFVPTDKSGEEYKKQLSLKYTYKVYNPYTQKIEIQDLSPVIKVDIPVSDKVREEIIVPFDEKRKASKLKLEEAFPDKKSEVLAMNLAEYMQRLIMGMYLQEKGDIEYIQKLARTAVPISTNIRNCQLQQGENLLSKAIQEKYSKQTSLTLDVVTSIVQNNSSK